MIKLLTSQITLSSLKKSLSRQYIRSTYLHKSVIYDNDVVFGIHY